MCKEIFDFFKSKRSEQENPEKMNQFSPTLLIIFKIRNKIMHELIRRNR